MSNSKRRMHNPTAWITEALVQAFAPMPRPAPIPVQVHSVQAEAMAGLQRRSHAARLAH